MQFELIGGSHVQDGKMYKKGDRIETKLNLVSMFGKKFRKLFSEEIAEERIAAIPTKSEVETKAGSEAVKKLTSEPVILGPDMTVTFYEAKDTGCKIHQAIHGKFRIVHSISGLVSGLFTRNEVVIYLKNNA